MTKKLLMGNEAMAYAALEAGVAVAAGYPGTPSSEIIETIANQYSRGAAHGVHVEWSTNEKAALELVYGASLSGVRGLFTCKQMGLNVASDALMSLNYVGIRGGLVLVVADDPGPISSQTEQDTRRFAAFAKVPVLDPSTPEQAYDMIKAAFELSERFETPVIVRPTTRVDHASAFFDVREETYALAALDGGFQYDPSRWVIFPRRAYEAHGEINDRLPAIAETFATEPPFTSFNPIEDSDPEQKGRPSFGILAGGISAAYVREALRLINRRVAQAGISVPAYRFMQIGTPYPFPEKAVAAFTAGLSDILVIEELDSVLEDSLAMFAGRTHANFSIYGRTTGDARDRGENDVDDILARIERFLGLTGRLSLYRFRDNTGYGEQTIHLSARAETELPDRPPVLCAGCPHRGAFYATKQALEGDEAVMCGDIGCYTLGNAHPLDAIDTCLCMGAGITMAQGIAVTSPEKKAIAYVGDSTFFASGETGISNAAYNGHDITVLVLDNSTTAMTGGQPHPGTGKTLMGYDRRPLSIEACLKANGFSSIGRADALDADSSKAAIREALDYKGPAAVILEGPCAQQVKPKPPVIINGDLCTGCKRCITSIGCPAISFNANQKGARSQDRGQAVIDTALCTGCGLCTQVCPFHAIHFDSDIYRGVPAFVSHAKQTVEEAIADQERSASIIDLQVGDLPEDVVDTRADDKARGGAHASQAAVEEEAAREESYSSAAPASEEAYVVGEVAEEDAREVAEQAEYDTIHSDDADTLRNASHAAHVAAAVQDEEAWLYDDGDLTLFGTPGAHTSQSESEDVALNEDNVILSDSEESEDDFEDPSYLNGAHVIQESIEYFDCTEEDTDA